jgi:hypothetical protein
VDGSAGLKMPDYSTLTSQIDQFKTAATALMTNENDPLNANELQLVGAALNQMGNTLGVADINNATTNAITVINSTKDAAITAFNTGTNGTRLNDAEADIVDLQGRTTNIEGFVNTNSVQYTTLQSTVSALQTSLSTVPLSWRITTVNTQALNNERIFVDQGGITVTLPFSPTLGYTVQAVDMTLNAATTNWTIARNTEKIQGLAEDLVVNVNGAKITLVYTNAVKGWVLV